MNLCSVQLRRPGVFGALLLAASLPSASPAGVGGASSQSNRPAEAAHSGSGPGGGSSGPQGGNPLLFRLRGSTQAQVTGGC